MMLKCMLPSSPISVKANMVSHSPTDRSGERLRSQNQYRIGRDVQSLYRSKIFMSHPAEAKAQEMPRDTKENKKAFVKQIGSSKAKFERKTA